MAKRHYRSSGQYRYQHYDPTPGDLTVAPKRRCAPARPDRRFSEPLTSYANAGNASGSVGQQ